MDTSQRARVTQAEGGAADRRAQEAAVSRGDYSNADGPVLAAEAVRRGLLSSGTGRGSAEAKSDSQLRTALKKHDREKVHSGDQSTRAAAAQTLAAARADKARLDAGGKARSDAIAQGRTQPSDTELDRGAISPTTARKMTDDQLDAAVRRLMASGTYSGPGLKVLEDELNRRDKARAGKARGR